LVSLPPASHEPCGSRILKLVELDLKEIFGFPLDDFQLEALSHLDHGTSVVVCAPTGAGKTVIAEYAVELALRGKARCFYTTPLKALSNQKLHDLQKRHGDDKVGLLTGDISINREAPVVVMTTEVFRNMLYGTSFGDVNSNLRDVGFVILDECHYMNDAERGTVWEESIIYAPPDIQLVALSATVANAAELTEWIDQTHGPTNLVLSDFRPVPLRFYYFGHSRLYPLLNQGRGLNPQLKQEYGKQNRFNKKGGGGRRNRMADVPDPREVVAELAKRNMLPAIFFLFSRRGCEEAMRKARGANLLTPEEKVAVRQAVDELVTGNANLESHPHRPYLYEGLSVHHAGMLPSWKAVVEKLFQRGLLKVVFATETLAAGINMPARTTVISAISKRSDDGHRSLTASEFLQMSGRAGRRGMDDIGHVVVLHHPFESVEDAGRLAVAPPDPLSSRFTPSYGMVLNLLQRHTMDQAKDLIERSFGQYTINRQLEPWFLQKMAWEQELAKLSGPLCPDEIGDLKLYQRRMDLHQAKSRQLRQLERGLAGARQSGDTEYGAEAVQGLRSEAQKFQKEAHGMPCHGCPVQKPCSKQDERVKVLESKLKEMNRRITREVNRNWRTFEALCNILRVQGYLNGETPTQLGQLCASIRATNELFMCEALLDDKVYTGLRPAEFAALMTALVTDEQRLETSMRVRVSPQVDVALSRVNKIGRRLYKMQRDFDIDVPVGFSPTLAGLTQLWAEGATWDDIRQATDYDEGDVVRSLRRTVDLCRQFARAPHAPPGLSDLCMRAEKLIARDEVQEDV
jgi:superfamily II RNA helicase